jgi:hypothetical protein
MRQAYMAAYTAFLQIQAASSFLAKHGGSHRLKKAFSVSGKI